MTWDDDRLAVLYARAAADLAGRAPSPPAAAVMQKARRRRRGVRAAAAGSAATAVAAVAAAAAFVQGGLGGDREASSYAARPELARTVLLGEQGARAAGRNPKVADPGLTAEVLAVHPLPTGGELLLTGVRVPDGQTCLLQVSDPPSSSASGACSRDGSVPGPPTGLDVTVGQDETPGQPALPVAYGSAPRGTDRVEVTAQDGTTTTARAYDGGEAWNRRAYFVALRPTPSPPARAVAYDADGDILASTELVPPP